MDKFLDILAYLILGSMVLGAFGICITYFPLVLFIFIVCLILAFIVNWVLNRIF